MFLLLPYVFQIRTITAFLQYSGVSCLIHIRLKNLCSDFIPSLFVGALYNALSISHCNMFDSNSFDAVAFVWASTSSVSFISSLKCFCLLSVILFGSLTAVMFSHFHHLLFQWSHIHHLSLFIKFSIFL